MHVGKWLLVWATVALRGAGRPAFCRPFIFACPVCLGMALATSLFLIIKRCDGVIQQFPFFVAHILSASCIFFAAAMFFHVFFPLYLICWMKVGPFMDFQPEALKGKRHRCNQPVECHSLHLTGRRVDVLFVGRGTKQQHLRPPQPPSQAVWLHPQPAIQPSIKRAHLAWAVVSGARLHGPAWD